MVSVNPAYSSRECSQCHHIDKRNRVCGARPAASALTLVL
ncbi:hypothetical protein [Streptomyces sp. NBC_00019]